MEILYDWLIRVACVDDATAAVLDDRIPDVADAPTAKDLCAYAGFAHRVSERRLYDEALFKAVEDWLDCVCAEGADSAYADRYRERLAHYTAILRSRGETAEAVANKARARARRAVAQMFLSHVWEAAYRLETGKEPAPQFARPILPEVPYPAVAGATA